jgi:hypothetical protein
MRKALNYLICLLLAKFPEFLGKLPGGKAALRPFPLFSESRRRLTDRFFPVAYYSTTLRVLAFTGISRLSQP